MVLSIMNCGHSSLFVNDIGEDLFIQGFDKNYKNYKNYLFCFLLFKK
jgi:hypothetical protein